MRILVAETTWTTAALSSQLIAEDIGVMRAADGEELIFMAEMAHLNGVVFDSRIRGLSLGSTLRNLRDLDPNVSIVVIGRTDAPEERVRALELGADDVATETTSPAEIIARIRAVVRRRAGRATPRIEIGPLMLDMETQTASVHGTLMRLTRLEYQLLEFLALGLNGVRTKSAILTQLYLLQDEPGSRIVDAYVCRIRRELGRLGADPSMLRTVWSRGYMLTDGQAMAAAA